MAPKPRLSSSGSYSRPSRFVRLSKNRSTLRTRSNTHHLLPLLPKLFTVPPEIRDLILDYVALNKSHLGSLALVNSACRQLVLPHQFNNVQLDYDYDVQDLVQRLQEEVNGTVPPSLTAYIRQLRLDTYFLRRVRFSGFLESSMLIQSYWSAVLQVIPAIPNLRSLCIRGSSCYFGDGFADFLKRLSIRNIDLNIEIAQPRPSQARSPGCPLEKLETLRLQTCWGTELRTPELMLNISDFYKGVLAPCCSNLRKLEFSHDRTYWWFDGNFYQRGNDMSLSFDMDFPKLKMLYISNKTQVDSRALSCLVGGELTSLTIPCNNNTIASEVLAKRGRIRTLETLFLQGSRETAHLIDFIEANPQIQKLVISQSYDAPIGRVIQSLRHHESLKYLSLGWLDKGDVSTGSLKYLSLVPSVEVLHLYTGHIFLRDWQLQHEQLRSHLSHLPHLRRLILTYDPYIYPRRLTMYYEIVNHAAFELFTYDDALWEVHKARMIQQARARVSRHRAGHLLRPRDQWYPGVAAYPHCRGS